MAIQGSHVEYIPAQALPTREGATGPDMSPPIIVRVFSSELAALRSAVENGNRHALVKFGETINEALERAAAEQLRKDPIGPGMKVGSSGTGTDRKRSAKSSPLTGSDTVGPEAA